MKQHYITFRSVTYAQRGEKLLKGKGYRCNIQRTPRWMEEQGCGYALRLWAEDAESAAEELRYAGVPMRRVYVQHRDGSLEEITV